MKKLIKQYMFLCAAAMLAVSCSSDADRDATENEADATEDETVEDNEEYREDMEAFRLETDEQISANEIRINELKEQADYAEENYKARVDELERQNNELRRKLENYEDDGPSGWEKFKAEFKHDMNEIGTALRDIGKNNVK